MVKISSMNSCKTRPPSADRTRREASLKQTIFTTSCPTHSRGLLPWPGRRELPLGSPFFPSRSMVSPCTRLLSMTLWLCGTAGPLPNCPPKLCDCGNSFTVEHALSCARGGFPTIRHNEIRDLTAHLLTEVCSDVRIEPDLQPVLSGQLSGATANTQDGARLDLSANGVWGGRSEKTFFDVRVFNPHAPSNKSLAPPACYRKHEREKKRAYEQRVREVEHSTFTPLVFSATGGMASEATNFYKRLASMLALKWDSPYSSTLCWLRCRLSFSLLRSAIQAIRGARSSRGHAIKPPTAVDLVTAESRLSSDLYM